MFNHYLNVKMTGMDRYERYGRLIVIISRIPFVKLENMIDDLSYSYLRLRIKIFAPLKCMLKYAMRRMEPVINNEIES